MSSTKIRFFLISIAVLGIALLYFFYDASKVRLFPSCPFHELTGLYCPGCGSQRALSSIVHGRLVKAVTYNPLFVLSLPLLLYSASIHTINTFRNKPVVQRFVYSPVFIKICLYIVVAFFILRNIPGTPFNLLRPA